MNIQIDKCQLFEHTFIFLNAVLAGYLSLGGSLCSFARPDIWIAKVAKIAPGPFEAKIV